MKKFDTIGDYKNYLLENEIKQLAWADVEPYGTLFALVCFCGATILAVAVNVGWVVLYVPIFFLFYVSRKMETQRYKKQIEKVRQDLIVEYGKID